MTVQILTCPTCGQQNRVTIDGSRQGLWKCKKCGNVLQRQDLPVMPAAQAADRARAPTRETRLEFSWPVAVKSLSIGVGIAAAGAAIAVYGDSTGAMIGGGLVALLGVAMLFGMMSQGVGGTGSCPVCSAEIIATSNSETYKLCPGCREYLTIRDGVIRQLDPSSITSTPKFAVPTPWEDLKAVTFIPEGTLITGGEVRSLHATWPDACCVCGEPTSRLEDRAFEVYKWNGELVRANQTKITLLIEGVPHCGVHSKGLALDKINFRSKGDDIGDVKQDLVLHFRSYAYRNQFLVLNRWPWR